MRVGRRALLGAFGATAASGSAAARLLGQDPPPPLIPIETFAAKPVMAGLTMSPDGTRVLARVQVRGKTMLATYVLATGELKAFALPEDSDLEWFRWAGDRRFLVSLSSVGSLREDMPGNMGYAVAEGRGTKLFCFDAATQVASFVGIKNGGLIGDDVIFIDPAGEFVLLALRRSLFASRSVYRITLKDNRATWIERGIEGVYNWYADNKGVVRGGLGYADDGWFFTYRSTPDQTMRTIAKGKTTIFQRDGIAEMSFVAGSDDGYVIGSASNGFNAVFKFNFLTQAVGDLVFACPTNDVESLDFGDSGHALEAVRYSDDRDRVAWMNPAMKEIQDAIDGAMPGRANRITSRSADDTLMIVHSSTPRDPGIYYVFDLASTKLKRLVSSTVGLAPAQLAAMEPVRYKARDGLEIPGYLTLPNGRAPKGLPLVIMPHGGPFGVRDTLEYDTIGQFLANRGYAVLQPNYRGSEGYGLAFFQKGQGEWGRKMQDDLDDGMDWLVQRGVVDPKRACLVGGSYGGYAAAWGATRNPERYRCAACFAGVFDLRGQLKYDSDFFSSRIYKQYQQTMQGAETFDLDSVSPRLMVDRLKVPVMLIHGDKDSTVPISQSKAYDAALAKAGKQHEFYTIKDEGHGYSQDGTMAFYLGKLEAFLKAHNPAG